MIRAFYSATAGMTAQQTSLDTIANNIANVDTTAFKSSHAEFQTLLSTSMTEPSNPQYAEMLVGSGAGALSFRTDMSPGGMVQTGSALDFAVLGNGFFAVRDQNGNTHYTRDGSFSVAVTAQGDYLVNAQGMFVLDGQGNPITVGADGTPSAGPGVVDFPYSAGLSALGGNLYDQTADSGAPTGSAEGFRQGYLEGSNVNLATEMTDMIETQRAYQFNSRVVQTADQIENWVNELKG